MIAPELVDFRKEIVQTAAVAAAIIEDIDNGVADYHRGQSPVTGFPSQGHHVLMEIRDERERQDEKWGPQHHRISDWLSILGEEYGEACKAFNDDILFPIAEEEDRLGLGLKPLDPVRWDTPDSESESPLSEAVEMMDLGTTITDFLGDTPTKFYPPRHHKTVETDIDPADELKGVFDRLRKEADAGEETDT